MSPIQMLSHSSHSQIINTIRQFLSCTSTLGNEIGKNSFSLGFLKEMKSQLVTPTANKYYVSISNNQ